VGAAPDPRDWLGFDIAAGIFGDQRSKHVD